MRFGFNHFCIDSTISLWQGSANFRSKASPERNQNNSLTGQINYIYLSINEIILSEFYLAIYLVIIFV